MPVLKPFVLLDSYPKGSEQQPSYTYFQLGCGACKHSVCFKASGVESIEAIDEIVSEVSPRRKSKQAITYVDANQVCPSTANLGTGVRQLGLDICPSEQAIETAMAKLQEQFSK
jgi:hypothetical protein